MPVTRVGLQLRLHFGVDVGLLERLYAADPDADRVGLLLAQTRLVLARAVRVALAPAGAGRDGQWRPALSELRRAIEQLPHAHPEYPHLRDVLRHLELVDAVGPTVLAFELCGYAAWLEQEGWYAEALEMAELYGLALGPAVSVPHLCDLGLTLGRLRVRMARWDDALVAYGAVETIAAQEADGATQCRAMLGRGHVLLGRGNLPDAEAVTAAALERATALQDRRLLAMAHANLALVADRRGETTEAILHSYRAWRLAPDEADGLQVLGDLGLYLVKAGAVATARLALERVERDAREQRLRLNAAIELLALDAAGGDQLGFRRRHDALERCVAAMGPSMQVDFRVRLAEGYRAAGAHRRAEGYLREALAIAEAAQLNQWIFRIEERLRRWRPAGTPRISGGHHVPDATTAGGDEHPAVREVRQALLVGEP